MIKVASIGECMVEMVQRPEDGLYRRAYGGDTFNMAQYMAWIGEGRGIRVSYVTALGRDRFGRAMLADWEAQGIDISTVMTTEEKNTGLYFADINDAGNRDYVFYRSDSAARIMFRLRHLPAILETLLKDYGMIYASAISLMILADEDRQKLIDLFAAARARGITTAFDTNYRAAGWATPGEAAKWMTAIMRHCDIVLPTNDENREVFGDYTARDTIARIAALGVGEIACKCGGDTCIVYKDGQIHAVPALQGVKAVDTTAAGDSFNAAYLAARLLNLPPQSAALWGHRTAAEVILHRGALIPRDRLPDLGAA